MLFAAWRFKLKDNAASGKALLIALIVGVITSGQSQAASSAERVRDECATEISLMCAGRGDVLPCLVNLGDDVTVRCKLALNEAPVPPPPPRPAKPRRATAVPGVGGVWFKDDYAGPQQALYPEFRGALSAEAPRAVAEAAKLMGLPGYASGFPRPLVLLVEYDPTQMRGLGSVNMKGEVVFNMAHWEDCPSRPILRGVVAHEFSHAMLHDLVGKGRMTYVPQWFDEGLATLAGGEPEQGIFLEAAYYRHGKTYPGSLACRLDNEGRGLMGGGLLTDCYPYYLIAVRHIAESSPDALPKVIADLASGIPLERSIPARVGLSWNDFDRAVDARVRRTFKGMSPLSRLTGRNWWRHVRWCRG